jgi:hypothetical protein
VRQCFKGDGRSKSDAEGGPVTLHGKLPNGQKKQKIGLRRQAAQHSASQIARARSSLPLRGGPFTNWREWLTGQGGVYSMSSLFVTNLLLFAILCAIAHAVLMSVFKSLAILLKLLAILLAIVGIVAFIHYVHSSNSVVITYIGFVIFVVSLGAAGFVLIEEAAKRLWKGSTQKTVQALVDRWRATPIFERVVMSVVYGGLASVTFAALLSQLTGH